MILSIIRHEMKLALSQGSGVANVLAFFVIAITLFAFALGPDKSLLSNVAPGIIWVCALLTVMLSLQSVFARDYEDGTLEILLMQGYLPEKVVFGKILSHWLLSCLPLILLSPVLGYMLQMEAAALPRLMLSLLAGTPTLSLIGGLGAALTLGTRRAAALLGLLVLPLYIPVLIFGISTATPSVMANSNGLSPVWILVGLLLLMLPIGIVSCTLAIKAAMEEG